MFELLKYGDNHFQILLGNILYIYNHDVVYEVMQHGYYKRHKNKTTRNKYVNSESYLKVDSRPSTKKCTVQDYLSVLADIIIYF